MRPVFPQSVSATGLLSLALLLGVVGLAPQSARAGSAPGMPLVLPAQSLPSMEQINGQTAFAVVCYSQAPIPGTGATAQTAVVDLTPAAGAMGLDGSFPLFMFPQDVPVVQQLNGGMPVTPVGMFQLPGSGDSSPTQVAQVMVQGPQQRQTSQAGCLLVCPVPSLPLMGQLNPGLAFDVLCTCQAGTGKVAPSAQTALLNIQPIQGKIDPSQPLPVWMPVSTLPALGQLNVGTSMDVINVIEMPVGGTMLPAALVDVTQHPQPLGSAKNSPPAVTGPAQSAPSGGDQGDDSGSTGGEGKGKGHGKGNGKGQSKKDGGDD